MTAAARMIEYLKSNWPLFSMVNVLVFLKFTSSDPKLISALGAMVNLESGGEKYEYVCILQCLQIKQYYNVSLHFNDTMWI